MRDALQANGLWGADASKHIVKVEAESCSQEADGYHHTLHIYVVRAAGRISIGGERHGGQNNKVNLTTRDCTCMVPTLMHVPCSHIIMACHARGVNHLSATFISDLFWKQATLKIWEKRFDPYLDPSHWPQYDGEEYIPDIDLRNKQRGRRKRKRL